ATVRYCAILTCICTEVITPVDGIDACTVIASITGAAGARFVHPDNVQSPMQNTTSSARPRPIQMDRFRARNTSRAAPRVSNRRRSRIRGLLLPEGKPKPAVATVFGL